MFTGLIQEIGSVRRINRRGGYLRFEVSYDESVGALRPGDSIAVNGVCLTATAVSPGIFAADLSEETQKSTTLGSAKQNEEVNLERPVTVTDPLGGHIVLGHVDGVGRIQKVLSSRGGMVITIHAPATIMDLMVEKGSIAVDGISLTVGRLGRNSFEIIIIPETQNRTSLSRKRPGDAVNLETDYLAKLVKKLLARNEMRSTGVFPQVGSED